MPCNEPPTFASVDAAIIAQPAEGGDPSPSTVLLPRTQYIPFESTFSDHAPERMEHQFRDAHFRADRQFNEDRYSNLSHALMYFFFCRYQSENMNDTLYTMRVPPRIRLESEVQMHDVMTSPRDLWMDPRRDSPAFRNWCEAFVRPASVIDAAPLSRAMHQSLRVAMQTVLEAHRQWSEAHPELRDCSWNELPETMRSGPEAVAEPGSPAWVRCHSVHMLRFQSTVLEGGVGVGGGSPHVPQSESDLLKRTTTIICPFLDCSMIVEQYNRHRRGQRRPGRTYQMHNTVRRPLDDGEGGGDSGGGGAADTGGTPLGTHTGSVGMHVRMHLDTSLVRNTIREVTGTDPYGNCYVGFCLIQGNRDPLVDNQMVTNMMMSRAMQALVYDWYRRFGVPMPYHSHVDSAIVRTMIQTAPQIKIQNTSEFGDTGGPAGPSSLCRTSIVRPPPLKGCPLQPGYAVLDPQHLRGENDERVLLGFRHLSTLWTSLVVTPEDVQRFPMVYCFGLPREPSSSATGVCCPQAEDHLFQAHRRHFETGGGGVQALMGECVRRMTESVGGGGRQGRQGPRWWWETTTGRFSTHPHVRQAV